MSTKLEFDVLANDKASAKLDKIGSAFGRFGTLSRTAGNKTAGAFGRMGSAVAGAAKLGVAGLAVLGASLVAAAPKVFSAAANLELMGKKAKTVFGSEIGNVEAWGKANAHAMGLTSREATGLAAGFADLLIPMGFTRKQAAAMATDTVGLSGALAEWSGGTLKAAEVSDILSAAFLGERDGLQALGISISQAEVDAALLAKGQDKLTGKARQQAEALATQALIMAKSTDAQAAFANGGDSLARKMEVSKAKIKEMGQELLVKATPALTKMADLVAEEVIPALERFGGFLSENKFEIMGAFIDIGLAVTGLVKIFGPAMKFMDNLFLDFIGGMVTGAAKAFGWIPEIGPRLQAASKKFETYRQVHDKAFDAVIKKSSEWNASLKKLKTEVEFKAKISDLTKKLKTAKTELANPKLTATKRAQIQANIADLQSKLRTAQKALTNPALSQTKRAQLTASVTDLRNKIATAQKSLTNPALTATKRAQLQANISQLQSAIRTAQGKINSLKGKTVNVNVWTNYFSKGTPTPKGIFLPGKAHGGPVSAGKAYIVGEKRPEVFVPDVNGQIIPSISQAMGGAAMGGSGDLGTLRLVIEYPDGSVLQQKLLKLKRRNGFLELGLA